MALLALVLTSAIVASAHERGHARHLSIALAESRSKWLAQHVCEDIDSPAPCHAVRVEECERLTPRKVNCGVVVRFTDDEYDCTWTMHVFYRRGEVTQSEGRSEC
jgi:hypothetical protein